MNNWLTEILLTNIKKGTKILLFLEKLWLLEQMKQTLASGMRQAHGPFSVQTHVL